MKFSTLTHATSPTAFGMRDLHRHSKLSVIDTHVTMTTIIRHPPICTQRCVRGGVKIKSNDADCHLFLPGLDPLATVAAEGEAVIFPLQVSLIKQCHEIVGIKLGRLSCGRNSQGKRKNNHQYAKKKKHKIGNRGSYLIQTSVHYSLHTTMCTSEEAAGERKTK